MHRHGLRVRGFAEVMGRVLADGKSLQGAFVTFVQEGPDAVRGVGSTNAEGRYRVIRPGSNDRQEPRERHGG